MDRTLLKQQLQQAGLHAAIVDDPKLKNHLLESMLTHIGDPEPELRDDLYANTFYEWIHDPSIVDHETLEWLLNILMDEAHLFYGLGESGTDSVFTRTFSVLIIGQVLMRHSESAFIHTEKLNLVLERLLTYFTNERDYRGFTTPGGWAHAAAHGAECFDAFIQCPECDEPMIQSILEAFYAMLNNGSWVFQDEEDERMARVIYRAILSHKLSLALLKTWLEHLSNNTSGVIDMSGLRGRVNSKQFVRCLYFKFLTYGGPEGFLEAIKQAESKLNRYVQIDKNINRSS